MATKNVDIDKHLSYMLDLAKELVDSGKNEQARTALVSLYSETMLEAFGTAIRPINTTHEKVFLTQKQYKDLKQLYQEFENNRHDRKRARVIVNKIKRRFNIILPYTKTKENVKKIHPAVFKKATVSGSNGLQIKVAETPIWDKPTHGATWTRRTYEQLLADEVKIDYYSTGEAAEILGVSSETIRRLCKAGRFPKAIQTNGGQWRIPKEYFKVSIEQIQKTNKKMNEIDKKTREQLGEPNGEFGEYDVDIDRT